MVTWSGPESTIPPTPYQIDVAPRVVPPESTGQAVRERDDPKEFGVATDALEGPVPASSGRGRPLLELLDKAIGAQTPLVHKNFARARQRNPEATPAEVVRTLERMYISALAGTGAAVGGVAAAPAVGTGAALALSAGESFSSLELSILFVLSVAAVHGVQLDEIERRRTIVMGILLGQSGSTTIGKVAERTGQHWGRQLVGKVPVATLRRINSILGKDFITRYGTRQGIIVLGQVVPFGIGALIGAGANATVAALAVRTARRAFGPAPRSWPEAAPGTSPIVPEPNTQMPSTRPPGRSTSRTRRTYAPKRFRH